VKLKQSSLLPQSSLFPSPRLGAHVPHSAMNERDKVGLIFMAVFIPCIFIGVAMCCICQRRRDPPRRPPRYYTLPVPGGGGFPMPYQPHVIPSAAPIPAHTASAHSPTTPRAQTHPTTFAEEAVRAAPLTPVEQHILLYHNGAMEPMIPSPPKKQPATI
jgi:hypothetical protein